MAEKFPLQVLFELIGEYFSKLWANSPIATIALSAVVFKERLTIQQWVGIALGFLSVFLLNSK